MLDAVALCHNWVIDEEGNESFVFLLELLSGLLFECMTFNFIIYVAQIVFGGPHFCVEYDDVFLSEHRFSSRNRGQNLKPPSCSEIHSRVWLSLTWSSNSLTKLKRGGIFRVTVYLGQISLERSAVPRCSRRILLEPCKFCCHLAAHVLQRDSEMQYEH